MNKPHRTRKTKRHKKNKTAALHYKNCVQKKHIFHDHQQSCRVPLRLQPSQLSLAGRLITWWNLWRSLPKHLCPPAFRVKPSAGESLRLFFLFSFHGGQRSHCASINANLASRSSDVPAANTQTRFGAEMVEAISMWYSFRACAVQL